MLDDEEGDGVVEEIGMTYTFIRTLDRRRLVVPNSKLASDTIINSIGSCVAPRTYSVSPIPTIAALDPMPSTSAG